MEVEHFIIEQLEAKGLQYNVKRDFIHVSCPFHEHSGTKLKLGFSRRTGGMNCWVCSKKGHWNEYAKLLGLETFDSDDAKLQDFSSLLKEFDRSIDSRVPEGPSIVAPWTGVWRGLPAEFLSGVPSYAWYDQHSSADRILWPMYVNDEFLGCKAARANPNDHSVLPKSRALPGFKADKILFPFDHPLVKGSKSIVIVEGEPDALRLLYHGIPAVSTLGTGGWNHYKRALLASRRYDRVVACGDGDLAGENFNEMLQKDLEELFDFRVMPFGDPTREECDQGIDALDPGNCSRRYLKIIKRVALG
jgi:hypothetical protein